jgi:RNA polymerase sigma factor (sigma-70 family)
MDDSDWLAARFEEHRPQLRAVAHRMLGSLSEADDAVQESWLRLSRSDMSDVENLPGWLATVVRRVCLDMLRLRRSRREESLDAWTPEPIVSGAEKTHPEHDVLLADSVGSALLVVLETLAPAERVAFVLHDMFAVPFDEIAPIVGRSPTAARQLASRARRRVQGTVAVPDADLTRQRKVVEAFLAASRGGDLHTLLAVLDPDVVLRADDSAVLAGAPTELRGASAVATTAIRRARGAQLALVDGTVGAAAALHGRTLSVLNFTVIRGKIVEIEMFAEPARLRRVNVTLLDG